ncbi:acyltransferase [Aliarcobacter cryaerophilus]|uniref:acyltransferase n=1 Tax=Aliarcobacter cryaerophilus TaxID=28198 RepID=UPI003BAEC68A
MKSGVIFMGSHFNELTSWEIREQILKYNATFSMTDVERANFLGLPNGCRIRENAKIISQEKLSIGENCWIGEGAILDASGELEIGSNTSIGLNVMVWTHDSHKLNIKGKNTREANSGIIRKKTKIGSSCFIAGPSVIMPGVTIGDKCIVAPMSVVYEDLPDRTIYQPYKNFVDLKKENEEKNLIIEQMKEELETIKKHIGII